MSRPLDDALKVPAAAAAARTRGSGLVLVLKPTVWTSVAGSFKPAVSNQRKAAASCAAFNANVILLSELLGLFLFV